MNKSFTIENDGFSLTGKPFRILSGVMHYFRIPQAYWEDRLKKLKAMGLNTVETYMPWNLHEKEEGQFDFSGILNIREFIRVAEKAGLYIIVRPGPYICAEWEFGGLPYWLLKDRNMRIRCMYEPYISAVTEYMEKVIGILKPWQITKGGNLMMMQIENEYGSYGNDKTHLSFLRNLYIDNGISVPLFTSDGGGVRELSSGTLPDEFKTINMSSGAADKFRILRKFQKTGPLMCTEFWCGWFDHWGREHHIQNPEDTVDNLDEILSTGASVNIYMFHGGTNFGFFNGANTYDSEDLKGYYATTTSYDYDAPLTESGDITPKYLALKDVIGKYTDVSVDIPDDTDLFSGTESRQAVDSVLMEEHCSLFELVENSMTAVNCVSPEPMEVLGQGYGFILYRTMLEIFLQDESGEETLRIHGLHDRAQVFLNQRFLGVVDSGNSSISLPPGAVSQTLILDILVENTGRTNYGPDLLDNRKGITESVSIGPHLLFNWEVFSLPFDDISDVRYKPAGSLFPESGIPCFHRGFFNLEEAGDTFLDYSGWGKGVCWINGVNIGRYWNTGPQRTLYVPGPFLKDGMNEVLLFELHEDKSAGTAPVLRFLKNPVRDPEKM